MDIGQRRTSAMRDIIPSGVNDISNTSGTTEEKIEDGLVDKGTAHSRSWAAMLAAASSRRKQSGTERTFDKWKANGRRRVPKMTVFFTLGALLMVVAIALLIYFTLYFKRMLPRNDIQRIVSSWGQANSITGPQAQYPTDFSRDIHPIPCHSHNDYWRRVPLFDALYAGCVSVEADVWFSPTDLLIGHKAGDLTQSRTLKSLYIDPIVSILSHQNSGSSPLGVNTTVKHGVFDTNSSTPLVLLIDIQTDGAKTFLAVQQALEPLRTRGWLTHFNGSAVVDGLVTVVGTGETPFDLITANTTYRDIFYDAPLEDLWGENVSNGSSRYTSENSYYASTNFEAAVGKPWHGILTPKQVEMVRGQVGEAQKRGIRARYWNTPNWPASRKEHVWDVLEKEGVGVLNADDLQGVSKRSWVNGR